MIFSPLTRISFLYWVYIDFFLMTSSASSFFLFLLQLNQCYIIISGAVRMKQKKSTHQFLVYIVNAYRIPMEQLEGEEARGQMVHIEQKRKDRPRRIYKNLSLSQLTLRTRIGSRLREKRASALYAHSTALSLSLSLSSDFFLLI